MFGCSRRRLSLPRHAPPQSPPQVLRVSSPLPSANHHGSLELSSPSCCFFSFLQQSFMDHMRFSSHVCYCTTTPCCEPVFAVSCDGQATVGDHDQRVLQLWQPDAGTSAQFCYHHCFDLAQFYIFCYHRFLFCWN